jgi:hypothetical protein
MNWQYDRGGNSLRLFGPNIAAAAVLVAVGFLLDVGWALNG